MAPCSINTAAKEDFRNLTTWMQDVAKIENIANNTSKCVDKDRREKLLPFLNAQKYSGIKGHGYVVYRIKGKAEIGLTPKYRSLFFPLSIGSGKSQVEEGKDARGRDVIMLTESENSASPPREMLNPGDYIHFTRALVLDAHLDCLIVLLPETDAE
ncbi:uncharacterized protein N7459_000899 [Penicillium hispanicum]|uniref:uncharacterized protein n=1 Tax=Penicillium hispanicum TaxID=1080232 RepID=UPI002541A3B4|nr:uncharacterized protein N7459_000899 [Penicillium hispanicum]KAJ5594691.1 hypothetical protein N7459_000899 [Penicillium hispanicum]